VYVQVRDEDVFKGLDQMVKNFLVSMPLVADLRSPAMRPRHWHQLATTTKVSACRPLVLLAAYHNACVCACAGCTL
jgi:hypothetical protein